MGNHGASGVSQDAGVLVVLVAFNALCQGWRVLDCTRFLPLYLPVNTIMGKTGFGHPKWEKLGKTQPHF